MKSRNQVKDLPRGTRVEVIWDDSYVPVEEDEESHSERAVKCYDLGYFDSLDKRGLRIWREMDEYGEFRWEMNIARSSILKVRRMGPPPRLATKPLESA